MGGLSKVWVADTGAGHGFRPLGYLASPIVFEGEQDAIKHYDFTKPKSFSFTMQLQDINPDVLRLFFGEDVFDNQEDTTSMTTTQNATKAKPTARTPDGTILRLVDAGFMSAKTGALAVVDGSKRHRASHPDNVPVRWIKGANDSVDGTYMPYRFELTGFAIGDKVRVGGGSIWAGGKGVIESEAKVTKLDVRVHLESGMRIGADLANLELVEQPLAEWEKELLGKAEPARLKAGEIAVIAGGRKDFHGLRGKVVRDNGSGNTRLKPIDPRPDANVYNFGDHSEFWYPTEHLRAFDAAKDFKVGDRVEGYGSDGTITSLRPVGGVGSLVMVRWGVKFYDHKSGQTLSATRSRLKLVGGEAPKPKPAPKPASKFKAGDKLRVIDASGAPLDAKVGDVVTVRSVDEDYFGNDETLVRVTGPRGQRYGMYEKRFEKVVEPKWKVGDAFELEGVTYHVVEQQPVSGVYSGDNWVHTAHTRGGRSSGIHHVNELKSAKRVEPKAEPKFKVGDRVRLDSSHNEFGTIVGGPAPEAPTRGYGSGPRYDIKFDDVRNPQDWGESKILALKPEDDPKLKPAPLKVGDKITKERFGELSIDSVVFQPNNLKLGSDSILRTAAVKTGPGPATSGGGAFLVTGQTGYKYARDFSGEYTVLQLGKVRN